MKKSKSALFLLFNQLMIILIVYNGITKFWLFNRRDRVTASGGEVGRLNTGGGTEVLL